MPEIFVIDIDRWCW